MLRRVCSSLERFSHTLTQWAGSSLAFTAALLIVVTWALLGPVFDFSDTWQLVINTGTTVITFLMVFLIQRMQNKDSRAIHLKLNELVAALDGASNRLVDVEDLSEHELLTLHKHYVALAARAKHDTDILKSHSVDEAGARHEAKHRRTGRADHAPRRSPPPATT